MFLSKFNAKYKRLTVITGSIVILDQVTGTFDEKTGKFSYVGQDALAGSEAKGTVVDGKFTIEAEAWGDSYKAVALKLDHQDPGSWPITMGAFLSK